MKGVGGFAIARCFDRLRRELSRTAEHDSGEGLSMIGDDEASRGKMGRLSWQAVGAGGGVVGFDGLMPNVGLRG